MYSTFNLLYFPRLLVAGFKGHHDRGDRMLLKNRIHRLGKVFLKKFKRIFKKSFKSFKHVDKKVFNVLFMQRWSKMTNWNTDVKYNILFITDYLWLIGSFLGWRNRKLFPWYIFSCCRYFEWSQTHVYVRVLSSFMF